MPPAPVPIACLCGAFRGSLASPVAKRVRARCYCDDCQAAARYFEGCRRASLGADSPSFTDDAGGTDVALAWPAEVTLVTPSTLGLFRLSPTGLCRWHATCCATPIANTVGSSRAPFVGVMTSALAQDRVAEWDPPLGIQGRFARGGCPEGVSAKAGVDILAKATRHLALGALRRRHRPHPFFDGQGRPVVDAIVPTLEERLALYR